MIDPALFSEGKNEGVEEELNNVSGRSCLIVTTVISMSVSHPTVQGGMRTSAGLALVPGRMAFCSFLGAKLQLAATW